MIENLVANLGPSFDGESPVLRDVLAPMAAEITDAQGSVVAAIDQMSMTTADGEWLDEWGGYFGVPRRPGESDVEYGPRVVVEVIRPKENNIAIAKAIKEAFGQDAVVTDVTVWDNAVQLYVGGYDHNGAITYSDTAVIRLGLFDIQSSYSLESGSDVGQFAANLRSFVERFRAAGTQLRTLSLGGSTFDDGVTAGADLAGITVARLAYYNGDYAHWGVFDFGGVHYESEPLS